MMAPVGAEYAFLYKLRETKKLPAKGYQLTTIFPIIAIFF
jgi:hypothetical protein